MKNITKNKGPKLIDKYRDGTEKLYALCDYINKKAMNWYALNIEFSPEDVELIEVVQKTMEQAINIQKMIVENEEIYYELDRGYEIHPHDCQDCEGKVKVIYFVYCQLRLEYNVSKCEKCGVLYEDDYPNTLEQCKVYFDYMYSVHNQALASSKIKDEDKISIEEELSELHAKEEEIKNNFDGLIKARISLTDTILADIKLNGRLYKNLISFKKYFDKQ